MKSCILVDLDGTLAISHNRNPFDYKRSIEDKVSKECLVMIKKYKSFGNEVIILSGRAQSSYDVCKEWLDKNSIPYDHIYLKPNKDNTKSVFFKEETFKKLKEEYNIKAVLDDDLAVVEMYRKNNITIYQFDGKGRIVKRIA